MYMAKPEYDKLITYKSPPNPAHPPGSFPGVEMFIVNDEFIKGAFTLMAAWFTGAWPQREVYKPHVHDFDEIIAFFGTNFEKPAELEGEIEFWIEDEKYTITQSCSIFLPKGLRHCPMWPSKITRPVLFIGTNPQLKGVTRFSRDPKWSQYKDPVMLKPDEEPLWMD
jgi:hypothetical protein